MWFFSVASCVKVLPHFSHWVSFCCESWSLFLCIARPALLLHTLSHISHWRVFSVGVFVDSLLSLMISSGWITWLWPCCLSYSSRCFTLFRTSALHLVRSVIRCSILLGSSPASLISLRQYVMVFLCGSFFVLFSSSSLLYHPSTACFTNLSSFILRTWPILRRWALSIFVLRDVTFSCSLMSAIFKCFSSIWRRGWPFLSLQMYLYLLSMKVCILLISFSLNGRTDALKSIVLSMQASTTLACVRLVRWHFRNLLLMVAQFFPALWMRFVVSLLFSIHVPSIRISVLFFSSPKTIFSSLSKFVCSSNSRRHLSTILFPSSTSSLWPITVVSSAKRESVKIFWLASEFCWPLRCGGNLFPGKYDHLIPHCFPFSLAASSRSLLCELLLGDICWKVRVR